MALGSARTAPRYQQCRLSRLSLTLHPTLTTHLHNLTVRAILMGKEEKVQQQRHEDAAHGVKYLIFETKRS